MTTQTFTAVYQQVGEWWAAWVEELPGANTQGRTLEEARANLEDAITLLLEVNREIAAEQTAGQPIIREPITVARA